MHRSNDAPLLFSLTAAARAMRKRPTKSEALLWAQLQGRKLGVRFRRQAPVDNFILDFYAACARLGVDRLTL